MAVMTWPPDHLSPATWLAQFLDSPEARRGGVVKRQIRDVERIAGRDLFLREVERRGFQVIENGRHFVVFCNAMPLRRVVRGPRDLQIPWPSRLQAAWNAVSKPR